MATTNQSRRARKGSIYHGLSDEQRRLVRLYLSDVARQRHHGKRREGDDPANGWSLYREPTTIHPPTTLRLHYRSREGVLIQTISITEQGVTKGAG